PALDVHALLAEGDLLFHRPLGDVAVDAHAAGGDATLPDAQLLLHDRDGLMALLHLPLVGLRGTARRSGGAGAGLRLMLRGRLRRAGPALLAPLRRLLVQVDRAVLLEDGDRALR